MIIFSQDSGFLLALQATKLKQFALWAANSSDIR